MFKLNIPEEGDEMQIRCTFVYLAVQKRCRMPQIVLLKNVLFPGFSSKTDEWLDDFDDHSSTWSPSLFMNELIALSDQIQPYYNKLHAYVRMKLKRYPEFSAKIKEDGYLPIHILNKLWGHVSLPKYLTLIILPFIKLFFLSLNYWVQDWSLIFHKTMPFTNGINRSSNPVTSAMMKAVR